MFKIIYLLFEFILNMYSTLNNQGFLKIPVPKLKKVIEKL